MSAPQEEEQLPLGGFRLEMGQRVGRIVDAAAIRLVAAHGKRLMARDGQLQHFDAPIGAGQPTVLLVRRHGGRHEPDGV